MSRSECMDPTSRISLADRGNLSQAQQLKQWATGSAFWAQVADALWAGLDVDNSDGAARVEMMGYDHRLQCALMKRCGDLSQTSPREMAGSLIWTLGQNEGKMAEAVGLLAKNAKYSHLP